MRRARILTNETCNQNCAFCNARRQAEDRAFIAPAAVRARIVDAVREGATELVFSGGEPTMRRDLAALVAFAHTAGAKQVTLETNGTLIDRSLAAALAAAGLDGARVHAAAWSADADELTRDPGGFEAALDGARALVSAGVPISIAVPVVAGNLEEAPRVPAQVVASGLPIEMLVVVVPLVSPDASAIAPLVEAIRAVTRIADESRRVGLRAILDPATYLPPCLFERPERVAHLYALSRGGAARAGYAHVEACGDCVARDRCPGLPESALASPGLSVRPLSDDRVRRRLTVISSTKEQIARELVAYESSRRTDGSTLMTSTIRVNFHCNQDCRFCFVSTHLPPPDDADVREAILDAARRGHAVALSGGEPTLNPRLAEYARLAKSAGVMGIELQTNATRLADPALLADLVDSGVGDALVSLHGSTAEISDAITGAPGTFAKTLLGLDALATTSIRLRVNFVFCESNRADFPRVIELIAARWPKAIVTLSFVGSHTDVVPRTSEMIPRYTDVVPAIVEGLALARAAGIEITGWESMCGLPLCLVPGEAMSLDSLPDLGDEDSGEFVKTETCARCALQRRCWGIRRGYVELHGAGELRAVEPTCD